MGTFNKYIYGKWLLFAFAFIIVSGQISEVFGITCIGNNPNCSGKIRQHHEEIVRQPIAKHTSDEFKLHRDWLVDEFFLNHVLPALQLFTEQMSAVAMQQTMSIGTFFDAKHQLETQRLLQELQVEAHIDYQPSEEFCWIGTNLRHLAASEARGEANTFLFSRRQMARHLGQKNMAGADNNNADKFARWEVFRNHFCDPQDSNWIASKTGSGLRNLCIAGMGGEEKNADIDYTRVIDSVKTITLGESSGIGYSLLSSNVGPTRRAVFALGNNLYGNNVLMRDVKPHAFKRTDFQARYLDLRSVIAKRSVAENSFNAILSMKAEGSHQMPAAGGGFGPGPLEAEGYLAMILEELGVPDTEIYPLIGQRPSYYAQLELMAKKIYQNPDFYSGLYDKPANVQRKAVALKAIEIMVDREIYESQMRQEMLSSVLLSARLREPFKEVERALKPRN